MIESIERLTKESVESVNWQEVAQHARENAKKGFEAVKAGLGDLSKGKVHLHWLTNQEVKEITLPLSGTGRLLKIENPCGDVKVVGGFDAGSITARAKFRGATLEEAKEKAREYTLIVEESDSVWLIRQPDVTGLSVDLEIQLPGSGPVEVMVESGDVQVFDTKGSGRVSSKSGNIQLRGLSGQVDVSAESGNVVLEDLTSPSVTVESKSGNVNGVRVRGSLNVRAASGDVIATETSGRLIKLETVSGNITLDIDEAVSGTVDVRTVSGNASVSVPEESDCRVSLSTLRGCVASNVSLSDEAKTENRLTGRLGDGSGRLDVSAVTGNVTLDLRGAAVSA
ncbi:MAG TPA: DUF4097 family beta strand repeat-containing protein [Fimbriimonas sp.]|nr:DUF4097 family beta strand repeat-containing protein [Fimbriimonas sp.]